LFWLATPESPFINQIGQFLPHKLFDFGDGFLEPDFGRAGDVEVERRILTRVSH
jgi:hypothetical protein